MTAEQLMQLQTKGDGAATIRTHAKQLLCLLGWRMRTYGHSFAVPRMASLA
jgi:hypothetical protein